jgi:hypothetical protein
MTPGHPITVEILSEVRQRDKTTEVSTVCDDDSDTSNSVNSNSTDTDEGETTDDDDSITQLETGGKKIPNSDHRAPFCCNNSKTTSHRLIVADVKNWSPMQPHQCQHTN